MLNQYFTVKFFLLFMLATTTVFAQTNPAIDSLVNKGRKLVDSNQDESLKYSHRAFRISMKANYYWGKLNAAQWIAEAHYYKGTLDSTLKYLDIAIALSRKENDPPEVANSLVSKAQAVGDLGQKVEAIALFKEAQAIMEARKDTNDLADLLLRLGGVYASLDRTDEAMSALSKSFEYSGLLADPLYQSYALSGMAIIQKKIGNLDKAIEMSLEGLGYLQKADDPFATAIELSNLGILYKDTKQYNKALEAYNESEELAKGIDYKQFTLGLADNKGILFNLLGRYQEAEQELRKCIFIAQEIGYRESLADAKIHLARSLYWQGKRAEARREIKEGLAIAREVKALEKQKDGHEIAEEIFLGDGNYRTAHSHAVALRAVEDSIFQIEKAEQINRLQTQYETAKKDSEIAVLNKNAELDQSRKQTLWISLFLLALTAAAWIYSLMEKRKKLVVERDLEAQQRLNAEQQLEFKHKELTSKVLQLARKNEFLSSLEMQVASLRDNVEGTVKQTSRRITRLIKNDIAEDKQWEQFGEEFRSLHKGYMEALTEKHGNLTTNEVRLVSLLMMNLSSKDIADTLRISNEGIMKARYRLRKKLNLDTDQDLHEYLKSFM